MDSCFHRNDKERCLMKCALIFTVLLGCCSGVFADETWQPVTGIKEPDIKEIAFQGSVVCAASEKRLYRSEDNGETWNIVFLARGEYGTINFIQVFRGAVFICTNKGLFKSIDGKTNWKKIFKGVGVKENNISHVAFSEKGEIYLGTGTGFFVSRDNGATWQKDPDEAGSLSIRWIGFLDAIVFIAAETGVYKKIDSGWKRVFVTRTEEAEYDSDSADAAESAIRPVNSIYVKDKKIFLATDSGIFTSNDKGESWSRFESGGLLSQKINRLVILDSQTQYSSSAVEKDIAFARLNNILFAATDKGIFIFNDKDEIWQALYKGMDADRASSIAVDNKNRIWAATDKGLYTGNTSVIASEAKQSQKEIASAANGGLAMTEENARNDKEEDILELFNHEPTIREVQKAAIEYAEVHPDKIKQWRSAAGKKALLPDVSVGVDRYV
ncbi:MAG: hypothetical protein KJ710_02530, partial [Candidatus Omnitrophica bacterium]|nr:hypothetical protein [Candidatus Omnitrophota bacterium]